MKRDDLEGRIRQMAVQYGCRTTPVVENPSSVFPNIEQYLRDNWGANFEAQVPPEQAEKMIGQERPLFVMQKTRYLSWGMFACPTLSIFSNTFSVHVPQKINNELISPFRGENLWLSKGEANRMASAVSLYLQDQLNVKVHRVGKIYEVVFDLSPEEKNDLFKRLYRSNENVVEHQCNITFLQECAGIQYNVVFVLVSPAQPGVTVRIDINNRNMGKALEPAEFEKVHKTADELMPQKMWALLEGTGT